jgi:hypothetical protein
MRKLFSLVLLVFCTTSLLACAPLGKDRSQVKCPACGFEFEAHPGD